MHLKATKNIFIYVICTCNFGLKYKKIKNFKLIGFSNTDWGSSIDDMRSASRYYLALDRVSHGTWKTKKLLLNL